MRVLPMLMFALPLLILTGAIVAQALRIRMLRGRLEQSADQRAAELRQANEALTLAREQAQEIGQHRSDFLSAMSHDIRTPLAGVIGMLKFALRDETVHARTQEYLRIGLHNGESLLAILNDILDFSRIDAGTLTLEKTSFRLADVATDAVNLLQSHADAKRLALRCALGAGLPEFVEGDPARLRQVLVKLLGNAIKFTDSGTVLLDIAAGAMVTFSVTDTGPGIAPEVLARLFQALGQGDHSSTRRHGGAGLGLAICQQLVTLMGGRIEAESTAGAGARFMFALPLAAAAAPPPELAARARGRHQHRLRVLCAEDVRTNQIIVGTLLETMGHQVHIVENGVEALHALGNADFDMVLMDGRMPLMDGVQATRWIREGGTGAVSVRNAAIPIIALSANASGADRERYLAAGMDGVLCKPIDERALFDRIEATIATLLAGGHALHPADSGPPAPRTERELALQFGIAPLETPVRITPLAGLSARHMERIAQAFVEEAPRRLALARGALEAGDASAAAAAFHALKGSAGYLSTQQLHGLAQRLETLAAARLLDEVAELFHELESAVAQAVEGLRSAPGIR